MNIKARVFFYDGVDRKTGEYITLEEAFKEGYVEIVEDELKPTDECSIIERYTGKKDKNGAEIYEGNTLKCVSKNEFSKGDVTYRKVIFGDNGWWIEGTHMTLAEFLQYGDCTIINQ